MADFLTVVSTKKVNTPDQLIKGVENLEIQNTTPINSIESALVALKSEPNQGTISSVLKYLTTDGFSLLLPEPVNASIAHQLVNDTIPHYWRPIRGSNQEKLFAKVLRNPTGIGHIVTRIRTLIGDSRQKKAAGETRDPSEHIEDLLDVLDQVLQDDRTSSLLLKDISSHGKNAMQKKLLWKEYLAQIASGRIISIAAEAEDVLKLRGSSRAASWMSDGKAFAAWLGRNAVILMKSDNASEEYVLAVVELCSKALSLGYTGQSIYEHAAFSTDRLGRLYCRVSSRGSSQRRLRWTTRKYSVQDEVV
jgi:telomere length regulation protein